MAYTFLDLTSSAGPCAIPVFIGNVTPAFRTAYDTFSDKFFNNFS